MSAYGVSNVFPSANLGYLGKKLLLRIASEHRTFFHIKTIDLRAKRKVETKRYYSFALLHALLMSGKNCSASATQLLILYKPDQLVTNFWLPAR